jgi:hypothetical protein
MVDNIFIKFDEHSIRLYDLHEVVTEIVDMLRSDLRKIYDNNYMYWDMNRPSRSSRNWLYDPHNITQILNDIRNNPQNNNALIIHIANLVFIITYIPDINKYISIKLDIYDIYDNVAQIGSQFRTIIDNYLNLPLFEPNPYNFRQINMNEENGICAICDQQNDLNSISLGCGHKFHRNCILEWGSRNRTCPLCRAAFFGRKKSKKSKKNLTP